MNNLYLALFAGGLILISSCVTYWILRGVNGAATAMYDLKERR